MATERNKVVDEAMISVRENQLVPEEHIVPEPVPLKSVAMNPDEDFFEEVYRILAPEDPSIKEATIDTTQGEVTGLSRRKTFAIMNTKSRPWPKDSANGKLSYSKMIYEMN